jgi:hypothetical protein
MIARAKGDADSRSDSNTGTHQADLARPGDHRYQLDHAATHGCPVLIRMRSKLKSLRPNGQARRQWGVPGDTGRDDQ